MKIDVVMALISAGIAGLIGYGFYQLNVNDTYGLLISIFTGVMTFLTLGGGLALKGKDNGSITNVKIVSWLFVVATLITNGIFSFFNFQNPASYIIVNGIEFLIFVLSVYSIYKALK